jgi:RNA polymerase sigma-70 factor (sigma-E family)
VPVTTGSDATGVSDHATALSTLYRTHRLALLRLAAFLTDDRSLAEDLVQDAFAVLHERWSTLADPAAAAGYLRSTVVNGARTAGRRRSRALRRFVPPDPAVLPAADFAVLLAEEHREVIVALRRLSRRQREVLVLRYWCELSEAEIAQTLCVSTGTVKATASRALDALERRLKVQR